MSCAVDKLNLQLYAKCDVKRNASKKRKCEVVVVSVYLFENLYQYKMRILLSITSNVLNENTVLQKETLRKSLLYTFLLQKPFECHYYANIRPVKNGRNIVRCPFLEKLKYIIGCKFNLPCIKILTY